MDSLNNELLNRSLKKPSYGFEKNGEFYRPTKFEIIRETLNNINIFKSKKNWIGFISLFNTAYIGISIYVWVAYGFGWKLLLAGFLIGFFWETVMGELYIHRYVVHRAFEFKNKFWRYLIKYCTIRGLPDEVHIIPHILHHKYSDKVGDPYHASGGILYCFFADINHQKINPNLSREEYETIREFLKEDIIKPNTYEQYQKWGSVCHPGWFLTEAFLQWILFSCVLYYFGGFGLIYSVFGWKFLQTVILIRNVNYCIHGYGKRTQKPGRDFGPRDFATNHFLCGIIGTNWHDHHHHLPKSANTGFMWWQIDWPWLVTKLLYSVGIVKSYIDLSPRFNDGLTSHSDKAYSGP